MLCGKALATRIVEGYLIRCSTALTISHMDVTVVNIPLDRFKQLFFAFDVNMDGHINSAELHTLINKSYTLFEHTLSLESFGALIIQLSLAMDTNADLLISYNEVLALFSAL